MGQVNNNTHPRSGGGSHGPLRGCQKLQSSTDRFNLIEAKQIEVWTLEAEEGGSDRKLVLITNHRGSKKWFSFDRFYSHHEPWIYPRSHFQSKSGCESDSHRLEAERERVVDQDYWAGGASIEWLDRRSDVGSISCGRWRDDSNSIMEPVKSFLFNVWMSGFIAFWM